MSIERVRKYRQRCAREYAKSIRLPSKYAYPDGNPIRPLPPIKVATGGLMIVGAYPSARFEYRESETRPKIHRLVPVADNLQPFAVEEYFDGLKVRRLVSGDGLVQFILQPLGLSPDHCWITDLVKVFLYKPEHIEGCRETGTVRQIPETRSRLKEFGSASLSWLEDECSLCKPKVVATLGLEVAQVVSGKRTRSASKLLTLEVDHPASIGGHDTLYLPHPDACRRYSKWRQQSNRQIGLIRELLS